jgi:hypothetical protein
MRQVESFPGNVHKSFCRAALTLSLLLALPNAVAQGSPAKNAKNDQFQDSLLARKGFLGEIYELRGGKIFEPGHTPLRTFLASYRSEKTEEKNAAFSFLLGVTDATEGKMWCAHDEYKSSTVFETLNEGLKKLKPSRDSELAAYVITEIFGKKYPCKKTMPSSNSFVRTDTSQSAKNDSLQKSILVEEGLAGERVVRQGEDIFVPNLPLRRFLVSYNSREEPEEMNAIYAFMLGVADATEGKTWCSYRKFKSITLREIIHGGLKELNPSRYDERAAYAITGILEKNHHCKKER